MSQANPAVGSAPESRHGSVPSPVEDDTHLELQCLHMHKKGMTARSLLVTSLGKLKCETDGLGWQWGQGELMAYNRGYQPGAIIPPSGHLATSGYIFWLSKLGEETGCYWHLVGGGQECYSTLHNTQDSPLGGKELSGPRCQECQV